MDVKTMENLAAAWAAEHAEMLGFENKNEIRAGYIWNPGGFVNKSFAVTDGISRRHIKLAPPEREAQLRQWLAVREHLERHYSAPKLLATVDEEIVPSAEFGLVFDFVQGAPIDVTQADEAAIQSILEALGRLHSDAELRGMLLDGNTELSSEPANTCADAFIEEYIGRFRGDLEVIDSEFGRQLLSFVPPELYRWFHEETDKLEQLARTLTSFQEPADAVVHNDLNEQNILLDAASGEWSIIDWDDVSPNGDPAMDYSVLLWPIYRSGSWETWRHRVAAYAGDRVSERLDLYFRAKLLDDVIDVLADYIEAEQLPEVKPVPRNGPKKRICGRFGNMKRNMEERSRETAGTRSLSIPGPMSRDDPHDTIALVQSLTENGHCLAGWVRMNRNFTTVLYSTDRRALGLFLPKSAVHLSNNQNGAMMPYGAEREN